MLALPTHTLSGVLLAHDDDTADVYASMGLRFERAAPVAKPSPPRVAVGTPTPTPQQTAERAAASARVAEAHRSVGKAAERRNAARAALEALLPTEAATAPLWDVLDTAVIESREAAKRGDYSSARHHDLNAAEKALTEAHVPLAAVSARVREVARTTIDGDAIPPRTWSADDYRRSKLNPAN